MTDPRQIIENINELPTLPTVVAKVNALVNSSSASAGDINDVISRDLSLSSKVLKLVNSSFYGFPRRITSITHAVVILGFNTIRNLALSAFVFSTFRQGEQGFDNQAFWRHSIGAAVAANATSQVLGLPQGEKEDAFMAGLLHDVGKVVMCEYLHDEMGRIIGQVAERDCLFVEAERDLMDFTHAELGGSLLDAWNLPVNIVTLVERHHAPETAGDHARMAAVIHFADIVSRSLCFGSGGDDRIPCVSGAAWEMLELSRPQAEQIMDLTLQEMDRVGAFLELA
ncbi:MAG: HDOD domain-containing protein [Planctomycetota bacterium]